MQFKDIVNQYAIANHLTEIIDSGRVSHAQMFLGDTKSGSLALAIAYAQYLNCQHRVHYDTHGDNELRADSCGECPSCKKFQQLSHSDLHLFFPNTTTAKMSKTPSCADFQSEFRDFLNAKNQRGTLEEWYEFMGVDNKQGVIRERDADELTLSLAMTSYEGRWKVVVVWMAEKINTVAANKILKTLEEPTPNTLLLLVSESSEKMLSTIISRTQIVRVPSAGRDSLDLAAETRLEYASLYVAWMRQLFKLKMSMLSSWVDSLHSKGREQQKEFLRFAQESTRRCFLNGTAGLPTGIDFGDEKFNSSFPQMITVNNVELLNKAFDDAIFAIERNAYGKIVFMELSFRISKALKKR